MSIRFQMNWLGRALGDFRPTEAAEDCFPLESLPPIDPGRLTGEFEWLGPRGRVDAEYVARLRDVTERLDPLGLSLPPEFGTYYTSDGLVSALLAQTSCSGDLFGPIPSPVEPDAHLVRFFRDQQDCVVWYFYLRPGAKPFVVHSWLEYEGEYEAWNSGGRYAAQSDPNDFELQRDAIEYCAPTFEEWAYRFWIENAIAEGLRSGGETALTGEQRNYLAHYRH